MGVFDEFDPPGAVECEYTRVIFLILQGKDVLLDESSQAGVRPPCAAAFGVRLPDQSGTLLGVAPGKPGRPESPLPRPLPKR